jgi:multisubunit Na+/H+ antiporter MnhE subunit
MMGYENIIVKRLFFLKVRRTFQILLINIIKMIKSNILD